MIAAISTRGRTGLRNSSVLFGFLMLLAIRAVASQASLAWDPSPDPSVTGYVLYYGEASRSYAASVDVGSQTSYTVPNLLEGHNYYFAVAARNSTGTESALSNEASAFMAVSGPVLGTVLTSATLPSSRAVQVGSPLTIFATIINAGSSVGTGCSIGLNSNVPATFGYQTTNPSTNAVSGTPNTPVDIVPGASQSFVLSLTPSAPINATDVQFTFSCANSSPAGVLTGINTLLLSASTTPTPDVIALSCDDERRRHRHHPRHFGNRRLRGRLRQRGQRRVDNRHRRHRQHGRPGSTIPLSDQPEHRRLSSAGSQFRTRHRHRRRNADVRSLHPRFRCRRAVQSRQQPRICAIS